MSVAWEYCVDTVSDSGVLITGNVNTPGLANRLNQFGEQGWELVSSYTTTYANGGTHLLVFIYKRLRDAAGVKEPPVVAGPGGAPCNLASRVWRRSTDPSWHAAVSVMEDPRRAVRSSSPPGPQAVVGS